MKNDSFVKFLIASGALAWLCGLLIFIGWLANITHGVSVFFLVVGIILLCIAYSIVDTCSKDN